jgi:hypothetical protein
LSRGENGHRIEDEHEEEYEEIGLWHFENTLLEMPVEEIPPLPGAECRMGIGPRK